MRTTTANFKRAFQRGTQDPIVVSRICYRHPGTSSGGATDGEALYHFDVDDDDTVADSSGNARHAEISGEPWAGDDQYLDSDVTGTGFDKAIRIRNQGWLYPVNYLTLPDCAIGESDFTLEFWWKPIGGNYQGIFSQGSGGVDSLRFSTGSPGGLGQLLLYQLVGATGYTVDFICDYEAGNADMNHVALVRAATSGGNSQWDLYWNGEKQAIDSSSAGSPDGNIPTLDISGDDYFFGRGQGDLPLYPYAMINGVFDELRITKSALYTEDFTVPVVPFAGGGGSTLPDVRSWDVATDEIPGMGSPQIILGRQSDGVKPALIGITQIGQKLDPLTRTISTGDLTLTVAGRDIAAALVPDPTEQAEDQTFFRKLVEVYLAHPELTDPADWLKIFHGYTDDVVSLGGDAVEFRCKNFDDALMKIQWGGTLQGERPITHAWNILNYIKGAGIMQQSLLTLDGTGSGESFSPDNVQIAGTKSWAFTTFFSANARMVYADESGAGYGGAQPFGPATPLTEGFPGTTDFAAFYESTADTTAQTVSALGFINLMLRPYMGSVWINGAGLIKFQAFHTTTDRDFTEDQYQDFTQISGYKGTINKVTAVLRRGDKDVFTLTKENNASVSKYGAMPHKCPQFPIFRSYLLPVDGPGQPVVKDGDDGAICKSGALSGFTGWEYSPASVGELGYLLFAPWNQVASYGALDKNYSTSATSGQEVWYLQFNADGSVKWHAAPADRPDVARIPLKVSFDIVDAAIDGLPAWAGGGPPDFSPKEVTDVTQWNYYTEKVLDRFAVGTPIASVVVDMSNADLEIGDIITLDNADYLWEGFTAPDLLKWEITSIEFNPTEDNPGIRLDLCAASQGGGEGFTTHVIKTDWVQPVAGPMGGGKPSPTGEPGALLNYRIISGFLPSYDSGTASIVVGSGALGDGTSEIKMQIKQGRVSGADLVPTGDLIPVEDSRWAFGSEVLTASFKYRVYAGSEIGAFTVQSLAKSSSDEFVVLAELGAAVCEFTTDASADPESASLVDLREVGTVFDASVLPAGAGGANLGFESWKYPDTSPDSWEFRGSPANWAGYFTRYTADSKTGAQCLKLNTADAADLTSKWFTCKPSESRRLVFWHNPTSASAKVTETIIEIEQRDRDRGALASLTTSPSGATADTWYENTATHTLNASAAFYRFRLKRSGVTTPAATDAVLIDDLSFNPISKHGALAGRSSDQTIPAKGAAVVAFDQAVVDGDGAFTISGADQGLWFAPASGLYRARWHLTAKVCDNAAHFDAIGGVILAARTGTSGGTLDATVSTTYLQTYGQDGDACTTGSYHTFFKGDCVFDIAAGESFGLAIQENADDVFTLYGATGAVTPGCWLSIEAVKLSE